MYGNGTQKPQSMTRNKFHITLGCRGGDEQSSLLVRDETFWLQPHGEVAWVQKPSCEKRLNEATRYATLPATLGGISLLGAFVCRDIFAWERAMTHSPRLKHEVGHSTRCYRTIGLHGTHTMFAGIVHTDRKARTLARSVVFHRPPQPHIAWQVASGPPPAPATHFPFWHT